MNSNPLKAFILYRLYFDLNIYKLVQLKKSKYESIDLLKLIYARY